LRVLAEIRNEGEDRARLAEPSKKGVGFDFKGKGEQRDFIN
jgi:hypothetical protein